ncbi:hypothetical protein DRP04_05050 [Archaeoglobales archaeon]|nr:MAG: hypothetical protein DRP04_05050 [Archaeoglobales archaeon]
MKNRLTACFNYIGQDSGFLDIIFSLLPKQGKMFVEPFGGSAVVSLNVAYFNLYPRVILNDLDEKIFAVYVVYKFRPDILNAVSEICKWIAQMDDDTIRFKLKPTYLKKLKLLIENKTYSNIYFVGFASLLLHVLLDNPFQKRTHLPRIHCVNTSKNRYLKLFQRFKKIHHVMQRIEIRRDDAFKLIPELDSKDTVFYIDPPHLGLDYYFLNFDAIKAIKLAKLLTKCEGKVLVKYSVVDRPAMQVLLNGGFKIAREVEYTSKSSPTRDRRTYYFLTNYEVKKMASLTSLVS